MLLTFLILWEYAFISLDIPDLIFLFCYESDKDNCGGYCSFSLKSYMILLLLIYVEARIYLMLKSRTKTKLHSESTTLVVMARSFETIPFLYSESVQLLLIL